jgi:hypothetical protein
MKTKILSTAFIQIKNRSISVLVSFVFLLTSCQKETGTIPQQEKPSVANRTNNSAEKQSKKIYVSNVNELYAAINGLDNAGATLVLAPGTYRLNANHPKAGRLELEHDMSLVGQPGDAGQVIIDVTDLPASSFTIPPTPASPAPIRTGAIRMGNGKNSLEWLTLKNDPQHIIRSLVQTDIVATPIAEIRIAHTVIKGDGCNIGMSVGNFGEMANGRVVQAKIEDNEIMDNINPAPTGNGTGIQIVNHSGTNDASVIVTLSRNYIHHNKAGMIISNISSQHCAIEIKSYDNKIEDNGVGLAMRAGFNESVPSISNSLKFDAYATTVKNNTGNPAPPFSNPTCGVFAAGGGSMLLFGLPGTVNNNRLDISFYGCTIEGNAGTAQILAYGAHSTYPLPTPAGIYNETNIYLHGISANATISAIASLPVEPAGTNTINVYR